MNALTLWWICEKNQKKPTSEIGMILKRQLQSPDAEYLSALFVAGSFIHKVWLEVTVKEDKLQIIDLAIEAIMTGRDFKQTTVHLKEVLTVTFKHYKSPLPILFEQIDNCNLGRDAIAVS